jgi:hypothetical protein
MRGIAMMTFAFVFLLSALRTEATCCKCEDPITKVKFGVYTPTGVGKCSSACASSRGTYTDVSSPGSCPTGPTPSLVQIIAYSIGHQGASVWAGDGIITGVALQQSLAGTQKDWEHGQKPSYDAIMAAPLPELEEAARQAIAVCQGDNVTITRDLPFTWNKGFRFDMWDAAVANDARRIRDLYATSQGVGQRNDQTKNMLHCYSDAQVLGTIRAYGNPGPRPAAQKETKTSKPIDKH